VKQVPVHINRDKIVEVPREVVKIVELPGAEKVVALENEVVKTIIQEKIVPVV